MSTRTVWGPVLLQAAESLDGFKTNPAHQSDVEIYWDIVFAAAHQHSVAVFRERSDPRLDKTARALNDRLEGGWLAGRELTSPQSVYSASPDLWDIKVANPEGYLAAVDKPIGAFWTSSFLPDGVSAWQRSERSEFSHQSRDVKRLHFKLAATDRIFSIRSVADYKGLVTSYPRRISEDRVGVDWVSAARDYIAVHLTAAGLARAQNFQIETDRGVAELSGWDSESTAWLGLPSRAYLSDD